MFERPIQNGQCVDSTPQDMMLTRYRAHVLHSLLEAFVQRRGLSVLAKTLPTKEEHMLMCRMTEIQRKLYSTIIAELVQTKAMANPLKAFAICCSINFVQHKLNEDFDLKLEDLERMMAKRISSALMSHASQLLPPAPNPFSFSWHYPRGGLMQQQQQQ